MGAPVGTSDIDVCIHVERTLMSLHMDRPAELLDGDKVHELEVAGDNQVVARILSDKDKGTPWDTPVQAASAPAGQQQWALPPAEWALLGSWSVVTTLP
jgi:hypothetical protein